MRTFAIALCLLFSTGAIAGETAGAKTGDAEESHGRHSLGVFAGITREDSHNRSTLGIEYSYRLHENWSVGGVVERADRDKDSTLVIAFVHFWPTKDFYFGVGVGGKDPADQRELTFRGTIGYEFELGEGWSISPQANLDVIKDESNEEVYGLVLGKRF